MKENQKLLESTLEVLEEIEFCNGNIFEPVCPICKHAVYHDDDCRLRRQIDLLRTALTLNE